MGFQKKNTRGRNSNIDFFESDRILKDEKQIFYFVRKISPWVFFSRVFTVLLFKDEDFY
jgi:hypothetical protein